MLEISLRQAAIAKELQRCVLTDAGSAHIAKWKALKGIEK